MSAMTDADEGLTVRAAASAVGVSVRTLHHWDAVGVVSPSSRTRAGHRRYGAADVERLHRAVAYRDSGLALEAIRDVLDGAGGDIAATLRQQRTALGERIRDLQRLDERLGRMQRAQEHGLVLDEAEQRAVFGEDWDPGRTTEARRRWGDTTQWAQFAERSAQRGPDEWRAFTTEMTALETAMAAALRAGAQPGDAEADALVDAHRALFSQLFPISREMQVCLGRMYEADPAFTAHYDDVAPGLTAWLRRSIDARARAEGIDPEAATWR
jgi:MerR family transcriptional regulator, thiopeptide resistance regulator